MPYKGCPSLLDENRYRAAHRAHGRAADRCDHEHSKVLKGNVFHCVSCDKPVGFLKAPDRPR